MSVQAMSAVWASAIKPPSLKLIVLALADWSNDEGGSLHPSMSSIAKKVGVSRCQAQRLMQTLKADGILTVVGNPFGGAHGSTPRYQLNLSRIASWTGSAHATGSASATGSTDATPGVAPMHRTGSAHATLSINNHQRTTKARAQPFALPDWIPAEPWAAWIDARKAARKPLTDAAKALAVRKLDDLRQAGNEPGQVLEQSVLRGWQGLFEIKDSAPMAKPRAQESAWSGAR